MRLPQGKWLPLTLLLLIAGFFGGFAWLVMSEAGLALALGWLRQAGPVEIEVEDARGRLAGPLDIGRLTIRHARAVVTVEGLSADYEPSEIFGGRIAAERVTARRVTVQVLPRSGPSAAPAFMPRWLSAAVSGLAVDEADIQSPGGTQLLLRDLRASVHVNRSRIRFRGLEADAGHWSVAGGDGRVLAREPLGIEARARFTALPGRELQGELRLAGDLAKTEGSARLKAPGTASAAITLNDLSGPFSWNAEIELESLDLAQWWPDAPLGPLRGRFASGGGSNDYGAKGRIEGAGLPREGLLFSAQAGWAAGVLDLQSLTVSDPATTLRVELGAQYNGAAPEPLTADVRWQDLRWPLLGTGELRSPSGSLSLQGWETLRYQLSASALLAGLPPLEGSASGQLTPRQLLIEESQLQLMKGRVAAVASLGREQPLAWTLTGSAEGLDPAVLRKELGGSLSFDFAASGYGIDDRAAWAGAITRLRGSFRGQRVGGEGLIRHRPGHTEFEQVALALGPAQLQLDGAYGEQSRLDVRLDSGELGRLQTGLGGRVEGTFKLRGAKADLQLAGNGLQWGQNRAAILSLDASLRLDDSERSWLRLRNSGVTVAGQRLANARLSLDGYLREHRIELRSGAGGQAIDLVGQGSWRDGDYALIAEQLVARGEGIEPWQLDSPVRLQASAASASLELACFSDGPRRVCGEAEWQQDRGWTLRAATEAFPLEALSLKVPGKPHYRGLLNAEVRASGVPGQPWVAAGKAEIRGAVLEYRSPSGRQQDIALGRTVLELGSSAREHQLTLSLVDAAAAQLRADLTALRNDALPWRELPVSGRVRGATRQLDLLPLLLPDIDRAAGRLEMDLVVAGTLGAPLLQGRAQLQDGALDFYQANLRLRRMAAVLDLQDGGLVLQSTAGVGEGQLDLDGRLNWRSGTLDGDLNLKGQELLLVNVPEAKVTASPDLRFQLQGRRIRVSGTVEVPRADIDPADTAGAVLPTLDEQIVGIETAERVSTGFEVESDVRLVLGRQVRLNAYGLSGRVTGSLRTRSLPGELATGTGELEITEGRYRAYTRELEIERGKLLFAGGPVTDPGVDLRASRSLPGRKVGVLVRGRLRRPQLSLYSEPPLPQSQIASLLIVGQTLDSLQDSDPGTLEAQRASLVAQGGVLVAGQLGRYVGLDEVGIAQDSADSTALVLGKFLSPRLYVSYGISLVDEINTIKLRYTIGNNWAIRLESGREASADVEYKLER